MNLHDLAVKYSNDKLYFHEYMPMYEEIFKGMQVDRLLEIGIGYEHLMAPLVPKYIHGSSLYMWRDYFPNATIFSCDIRPEVLINEPRIRSMVCDQSNIASLRALVDAYAPWDVVIDDGSHKHEDQLITALTLLPYVNLGGVYVIEDVMTDKADELAQTISGFVSRGTKRCDDNLVIKVRK